MKEEKISRTVLLKLIEALMREEDLETVSRIISADPHLTAKILTFVNSAYCNLRREIHSVEDAVAYIGYRKLKEIAFALLLSVTLTEKSKEELLRTLKLVYLNKAVAKRVFKKLNLENNAFLIGILSQVYDEKGEELERVCVSRAIIEGLRNNSSPLGKVRVLAEKLLPWCDRIVNGDKNFKLPCRNLS